MAYRYGTCNQIGPFSKSTEEYISPDNPVCTHDVFMEAFDFRE